MATYIVGDIQGCFDELQGLLQQVAFDPHYDCLWCVGDLINRGPKSLQTLRFIKALPNKIVVLGNHDLHLLAVYYGQRSLYPDDTLAEILTASDTAELINWVREQKLAYYDAKFDVFMAHAGVAPMWTRHEALILAAEVEACLQGVKIKDFLANMYGNEPDCWQNNLSGYARLRVITNYFTRMRFCDRQGRLRVEKKTAITDCPQDCVPWFEVPERKMAKQTIVFGHWSALVGKTNHPYALALDTGVVWGGSLTALRLDDMQYFSYQP